jgi:hypothetical protein
MSATLTWASSGLGAKTGTARADFFNDLAALVSSVAPNPAFSWQIASASVAGNPNYIVLKRKDGSPGRILIVGYTGAPAGANTTIFDVAAGSVLTTLPYIAWFPSGNVDTPSNLTSASGTILGNDAGAVKVGPGNTFSPGYGALIQHFLFDSEEGIWFCTQNPGSTVCNYMAAGDLLVDAADVAYGASIGGFTSSFGDLGISGSTQQPFSATKPSAGSATQCIRTNHGAANSVYYHGMSPNGVWAAVAPSSTDVLTNTSANKAWFVPIQLIGNAKGGGFVLKHRQFGYGPGTVSALQTYQITGPVTVAVQMNARVTGGNGSPWLTNFKI